MRAIKIIFLCLILTSCGSRKVDKQKVKYIENTSQIEKLNDSIRVLNEKLKLFQSERISNALNFSIKRNEKDTIIRIVHVKDTQGNEISTQLLPSDELTFGTRNEYEKDLTLERIRNDSLVNRIKTLERDEQTKIKEVVKEVESKSYSWQLLIIGLILGFCGNILFKQLWPKR